MFVSVFFLLFTMELAAVGIFLLAEYIDLMKGIKKLDNLMKASQDGIEDN